jgi:pimeloyl-ACP methyl ester carboxylesterase
MTTINGFDFYSLNFDENGKPAAGSEMDAFTHGAEAATDAILIAHGFRNDVNDATTLYTKFLGTFRDHLNSKPEFSEVASRKFVVGGVFWPSKALPEEFHFGQGSTQSVDDNGTAAVMQKLADLRETVPAKSAELDEAVGLVPQLDNNPDAQDRFAKLVLSTLEGSQIDATEGLPQVQAQTGSQLFPKLAPPLVLAKPDADADADASGGVASFDDDGSGESLGSVFGSILGGVDKFLNLTTWYVMKNRSGVVGMAGVAQAVRDLKALKPGLKVHLVGHSLGGRLMAGCAKSLADGAPMVQPDSLTLLEAAFSHYGFSANNGKGIAGFFRAVIDKQVVKGPMLETFSYQDTVVGLTYAIASRLADDNVKAVGDKDDEFGGIGRNGAQKTAESDFQSLKPAASPGAAYVFKPGCINCLDGSGGLIKDHGDVTNSDVTYAFASAVAATKTAGIAVSSSALHFRR